jgi:hypothetical protein
VRAISAAPDRHAELAGRLRLEPARSLSASIILQRAGHPIDDKVMQAAAEIAVRPDIGHHRSFAWKILELGDPQWRTDAGHGISAWVERHYHDSTDEQIRSRFVESLRETGLETAPALLTALSIETNLTDKMNISSALFSLPGILENVEHLGQLRGFMATEVDGLLAGNLPSMNYLYTHPGGVKEAAYRYSGLVRDMITAFARPEHVPAVHTLPRRIRHPEYGRLDDGTRRWFESLLQDSIHAATTNVSWKYGFR